VRRAVITGAGLVTCLGTGTDRTWQRVRAGESGIATIESFDTSDLRTHIGGEVRDFQARDFLSAKDARHMDRFIQYTMACARMALEQSRRSTNSREWSTIRTTAACRRFSCRWC